MFLVASNNSISTIFLVKKHECIMILLTLCEIKNISFNPTYYYLYIKQPVLRFEPLQRCNKLIS